MVSKSIRNGVSFIGRKPGLVILIYVVNVLAALLITLPLYSSLSGVIDQTGFGFELAEAADIVVWADILGKIGPVFGSVMLQLLWIFPILFVTKIAMSVGLINAARDGGIRSFWPGVGYYTGKGLLLGLLYLFVTGLVIILSVIALVLLMRMIGGEVAIYRISIFVIPITMLAVFAFFDLAHDYARIRLVKDETPILKSFFHGFSWPWQHLGAIPVYFFWYAAALVLVLIPTFLDTIFAGATLMGIVGLFLTQQIALLFRSAATVGWFGSEVAYYENIEWGLTPMIASSPSTLVDDTDVTVLASDHELSDDTSSQA